MSESVTIRVGGFTGLLIYAAIGLVYQLVTGDGPFSWSDPWTWITMGLWPFFLLGWVFAVIAVIFVVIMVYAYFFEELPRKRRAKQRREDFERDREERRRQIAKATPPIDTSKDKY